jgi:large subunit ribosomal protein L21
MSQYIVESGTKQFVVQKGELIVVDRLVGEINTSIDLPVIFSFDGSLTKTISAKIVEHRKGKKIRVVKFRNKSNYHKVSGFRPYQTVLEII